MSGFYDAIVELREELDAKADSLGAAAWHAEDSETAARTMRVAVAAENASAALFDFLNESSTYLKDEAAGAAINGKARP